MAMCLHNWPNDDTIRGCYHSIYEHILYHLYIFSSCCADLPSCNTATVSQFTPKDKHHCQIRMSFSWLLQVLTLL